jgi:hypothetical protein
MMIFFPIPTLLITLTRCAAANVSAAQFGRAEIVAASSRSLTMNCDKKKNVEISTLNNFIQPRAWWLNFEFVFGCT